MKNISVIMSTYNESESYLRLSIESILNQTLKDFYFYIVLDNPENKLIENVVNEYSAKDNRIIVIKNEINIGLTDSLNKAILHSNTKYIARMDADDIAVEDRLEKQLKYLEQNNYDLIGSKVRTIDSENFVITQISNHPQDPVMVKEILLYDNCIAHPTWFFRREVFDYLEGYRNIHTCEDYDFLLRASKKFKLSNISEVLLSYRIHEYSISRSNSLKQLLTMKFLQDNINTINNINQGTIDTYISKHLSEKSKIKYNKSEYFFRKAVSYKNKGNVFLMFSNLMKALTQSKYFRVRIKNMLFIRTLRRKHNYN